MSLTDQGKLNDAVPIYKRVCTVTEKVLGADHPDTRDCLNNLEELLKGKLT
jgi:hypothetical protein